MVIRYMWGWRRVQAPRIQGRQSKQGPYKCPTYLCVSVTVFLQRQSCERVGGHLDACA